jgi:hypothetical protein
MPRNRIIYIGILVLLATAVLWLGIQLRRIEWLLPYVTVVGVALVVIGFLYELWKSRKKNQGP